MGKSQIINTVSEFSKGIIEGMGYKLVKIEYVREGKVWVLRFCIDKKGGITIEDCEQVSNVISRELDIRDPIPQQYILEVSSAGLERELKDEDDIRIHINDNVIIRLNNKEIVEGTIYDFESKNIYLKVGSNIEKINMNDIDKIKLKFKF